MATSEREHQFEAAMLVARAHEARKALFLSSVVGLVGAVTFVSNVSAVMTGSVPGIGQSLVGVLGIAAAAMVVLQRPSAGWLLAMAWALVQIPFYAWTPDGSATAQVLQIPLTMTNSSSVNGQLVSYASVGINLAGVIFAVWLRRWQEKFGR